jgi:hypothetical protein
MTKLRRFEILLPLRLNDGQPVPVEWIVDTCAELEEEFGAVTWEQQPIQGMWRYEGTVFRDSNTRLIVDVPDTSENQKFFISFKEKLKRRFDQIDIWLISHAIDVI